MQQLSLPTMTPVYRIKIEHEDYPESPRDWSNLGTMVCWHSRYRLGDEQPREEPQEYMRQIEKEGAIILPLYLYDHGGITISTTPFSCRWDSGQVGFIYVPIAKIKAEYGWKVLTAKRREKIMKYLDVEVETYDQYLQGEVYGFVVEEQIDGQWEEIDSCWGFYGDDTPEAVHDYVHQYGFTKEHIEEAYHYENIGQWVATENAAEAAQPADAA